MTCELFGVVLFLGAALFLYAILGGADFGAGILELFAGREKRAEQRALITHAMAPVWEANHVWLVIVVVILFMGFPGAFSLLSIHLHLPLMAVLLGIVVRGTAFTFRHYDVSRRNDVWYGRLFAVSSLWTPMFLGITLGAAIGGEIRPEALDYRGAYVDGWLTPFSLAVGAFVTALFSLVAAVYLLSETADESLRALFRRKTKWAAVATVSTGAIVLLFEGVRFFANPISLACFLAASVLWFPLRHSLRATQHRTRARAFAGAMALLVFIGWYVPQYPTLVTIQRGGAMQALTFGELAAPPATLRALLGALVVGILLILPSLGYLLWVYKRDFLDVAE